MKILLTFILGVLCLSVQLLHAANVGIDIEVTISGTQGGGTNFLNSITKVEDNGLSRSELDGKINYEITYSYKIEKNDKRELILVVDLVKKGENNKNWSKKVKIIKNGKQDFKPFEGIEMSVESKGFLSVS